MTPTIGQAVDVGSVIRWETPGFDGYGEVTHIRDDGVYLVRIKNDVHKYVCPEIVKDVYRKANK